MIHSVLMYALSTLSKSSFYPLIYVVDIVGGIFSTVSLFCGS